MKRIHTLAIALFAIMTITGSALQGSEVKKSKKVQDVQVYSATDSKITSKTIEAAFDAAGLVMIGNNDMNKPFAARFTKLHYKKYYLAMFMHTDLTFKLVKKYPKFGALSPLTMSIWGDGTTWNIATLTINAMARSTDIPVNDPDLIAYTDLVTATLKKALPNGSFIDLNHTVKFPNKTLATDFTMKVELGDDQTAEEFVEDFEAEFEAEMEPLGFLLPNYTNMQEEVFDDKGYTDLYDYYHTYSICKFDVIYPVSEKYPEAGAWAPCSFYIYKRKGENTMYMGFLSVENWITTLDMKDEEEGVIKLREAQAFIENIINEASE
ncbi:hypothetical protein [Sulfurimonas sp.]|uniref:hypothetical protein n=1 Tax=Sulfurimonas sp. TaxID=2022749 RepID=UPI0026013EDC|nr:hypothetical protein [Sulfurimonas sp.]MBT5935366.1 hypothetical protein [Sulfurimonas sp.]